MSFSYEDSDEQVLRNASMEVCYGEVALLCGFSGEGKSTVLSLISGIIPDVTPGEVLGRVRVDGEDIAGKKLSEICRKVGVVLQNADAQIIQQIVEDEVAFGCENFAVPRRRSATGFFGLRADGAGSVLEDADALGWAEAAPDYSGGLRYRAADSGAG